MPKQCPECQSLYPNFVDFCVADGLRLIRVLEDANLSLEQLGEQNQGMGPGDLGGSGTPLLGRARLVPRFHGQASSMMVEFFGTVVLGRFDPSVGAVDIDMSKMPGHEYISPRHARLIFEEGHWFVEDLGSENGVFLDRNLRVTCRMSIVSGQELALGNALFLFEADQPPETKECRDADTTQPKETKERGDTDTTT